MLGDCHAAAHRVPLRPRDSRVRVSGHSDLAEHGYGGPAGHGHGGLGPAFRRLDRLPYLSAGVTTPQRSSSGPTGRNDDHNHVLATTADGAVLAEHGGPGEIGSIWTTDNVPVPETCTVAAPTRIPRPGSSPGSARDGRHEPAGNRNDHSAVIPAGKSVQAGSNKRAPQGDGRTFSGGKHRACGLYQGRGSACCRRRSCT